MKAAFLVVAVLMAQSNPDGLGITDVSSGNVIDGHTRTFARGISGSDLIQSSTVLQTGSGATKVPVWCYSDQKLPNGPRFADDDNVVYISRIFEFLPANNKGVTNLEGGIINRAWHSKLERVETSPRVYEHCVFYRHGETALAQEEWNLMKSKFDRAAMEVKILDWAYPDRKAVLPTQPQPEPPALHTCRDGSAIPITDECEGGDPPPF